MTALSATSIKDRLTGWAAASPTTRFPPLAWFHRLVRIILITVNEAVDNRLSLRASALTYALLLSMVPILAMSTAAVKGLGGGNQLREVINTYISTLEQTSTINKEVLANVTAPSVDPAPDAAADGAAQPVDVTQQLRSVIDKVFAYVDRTNFATLGTFGILGMFLSVILFLSQIETAMNNIWHVEDGRSILRKIADYLTLMVLLPISLYIALAAGTILKSKSLGLHLDKLISTAWMQALLLNAIPILFLTLTLYVLYIFFPNTKVRPVPTLIGALLGGTLWFVTQNLYITLQIGVAKYNAIYGSFATIPLFLMWMYFGWFFVLLGAQVAYAIHYRRTFQLVEPVSEPAMKMSAAFDLLDFVSRRFADRQGASLEDAIQAYPFYKPDLLAQARDSLVGAGILHHSQESGKLMPSVPPEKINHGQVIREVLGTDRPDTDGGRQAELAVNGALSAFVVETAADEKTTTVKQQIERTTS